MNPIQFVLDYITFENSTPSYNVYEYHTLSCCTSLFLCLQLLQFLGNEGHFENDDFTEYAGHSRPSCGYLAVMYS
jgi:hypothetical protein